MTGKICKGYISSREMGGNIVPQRVQNLVIRNFAEKSGFAFLFSGTEYYMKDCFMMLQAMMDELEGLYGLIFYSTHQIPGDSKLRKSLFDSIFAANCNLFFALEEIAIRKPEDIGLIEDILMCRSLARDLSQVPDLTESSRSAGS